MPLTYHQHRGLHHSQCQVCGKVRRDRIPDQASEEYVHNPGNPCLGLCPNCNGGVGVGGISLFPCAIRIDHDGLDKDGEALFKLSRHIGELDGWRKYAEIAGKFQGKVKFEDREDIVQDIMVRLAEIDRQKNGNGEALTEGGMVRTASYVVMSYWREFETPAHDLEP